MKTKSLFSKALLAVCFCFSVILTSNAQEVKKVNFGIKGGFNASSLSGMKDLTGTLNYIGETMDISTKYKPGFHAGLISQINITPHFFVQPELLYSMQGVKLEGSVSAGGQTESGSEGTTLNYLQLPIYAGYKINAGLGLNVIFGAGPYVGYGISGSDGTFDNDGIFQRFDFGLSAMGGVQFEKIQITIGYDLGLGDLVDTPGWDAAKDLAGLSSICNRNFKASVAYLF